MKDEFLKKLAEKKEKKKIIKQEEKELIDEQAKEYDIHVEWDDNKNQSNYFKEIKIYTIKDYKEEKIPRLLRLSNIDEH